MKRTIVVSLSVAAALLPAWPGLAQRESVKPGINATFDSPDVKGWVERFEKEGRDVYDRREQVVAACQVQPGMTVADVGAGTGLYTRLFAERVGEQGKVYAVDISDEFIGHIVERARAEGAKNIAGVVCKPDSVDLPPGSVDRVFICDTYHHFEFPQKTMHSLHAALKPGGQLILIDFIRELGSSSEWVLNHVRAGQEEFTKEIVAAGFRQIEDKPELLRDKYFVRFEKVEPATASAGS